MAHKSKEARVAYAREYNRKHPYTKSNYRKTPKGRFAFLKVKARSRKIPVALTLEEYVAIRQDTSACAYCDGGLPVTGHGLDRKDNTKGYSVDNVVLCCTSCNFIKNDLVTHEEMIEVAKLLKRMRAK